MIHILFTHRVNIVWPTTMELKMCTCLWTYQVAWTQITKVDVDKLVFVRENVKISRAITLKRSPPQDTTNNNGYMMCNIQPASFISSFPKQWKKIIHYITNNISSNNNNKKINLNPFPTIQAICKFTLIWCPLYWHSCERIHAVEKIKVLKHHLLTNNLFKNKYLFYFLLCSDNYLSKWLKLDYHN